MTEDARLTTYWIAALLVGAIAVNMIALVKARAETGFASVYANGDGHEGTQTANGERVNPKALTAAHKSLPFNIFVTVVNLRNGKSIVVRINDRGPYIAGRIIDLTPAGADRLGFSGLAPVMVIR